MIIITTITIILIAIIMIIIICVDFIGYKQPSSQMTEEHEVHKL